MQEIGQLVFVPWYASVFVMLLAVCAAAYAICMFFLV